ncbi:MAG: DUF3299 domain-containing protein, partial [Tepidisphaeraceae bacterium]
MLRRFLVILVLLWSPPAMGQTTQPSSAQALQVRAMEEFSRGRFATALPLLRRLADELGDEPDRLGQVQEAIRVCERSLAAAGGNPAVVATPPPTAEQRKPHRAPRPGEVLELEIRDLGNFEYDADHGGNIPQDVQRLSGATVRLRGYMIPMDQADAITEFALVPSLFACCFGQPPQVQHTIVV